MYIKTKKDYRQNKNIKELIFFKVKASLFILKQQFTSVIFVIENKNSCKKNKK